MQLDYKDIIIKHYALSMSGSEIARQTGFSKSGVNDFLRAFKKCEDLNYPLPAGITNYGIALKEDLIMAKQHDQQFKLDAVQYYFDHKELGVRGCAQNLGVGYSTLTKWLKDFRESGDIPVRGSGNYASDEQKEIARLKRKLRDAQDALDVLKKAISILGK